MNEDIKHGVLPQYREGELGERAVVLALGEGEGAALQLVVTGGERALAFVPAQGAALRLNAAVLARAAAHSDSEGQTLAREALRWCAGGTCAGGMTALLVASGERAVGALTRLMRTVDPEAARLAAVRRRLKFGEAAVTRQRERCAALEREIAALGATLQGEQARLAREEAALAGARRRLEAV